MAFFQNWFRPAKTDSAAAQKAQHPTLAVKPTSPPAKNMSTTAAVQAPEAAEAPKTTDGLRVNGKQWQEKKKAFRPGKGQTSYARRAAREAQEAETKKLENEMKAEKEEDRQRKIQAIKDKRAAKEERERYEKMAAKMHAKRVERLKRREKRNKLLKS